MLTTKKSIFSETFHVVIDGKDVYSGSYLNCCGYICCINCHYKLLNESLIEVDCVELGYCPN
jgi:hypothetical protein